MSTLRTEIHAAMLDWSAAHNNTPVPDFTTREKTYWFRTKLYVARERDRYIFVELYFYHKIERCILRSYSRFANTIFDKNQRADVVKAVHDVLTSPVHQELLEVQSLQPAAVTMNDVSAIRDICFKMSERPALDNDSQDAISEMIRRLFDKTGVADFTKVYSGTFLDAIIALARKNPKSTFSEEIRLGMEKSITSSYNSFTSALINIALLREAMGVVLGERVPCQIIAVADEVKQAVNAKVDEAEGSYRGIRTSFTIQGYLQRSHSVMEISQKLREEAKSVLSSSNKKPRMIGQLRTQLSSNHADPIFIEAYLKDEKLIAERLLDHSELAMENSSFDRIQSELKGNLTSIQTAICSEIKTDYSERRRRWNRDSFFACCEEHQLTVDSWGVRIGKFMMNDPKSKALIAERIKTDKTVPQTHQEYCETIMDGDLPELEAFSRITETPVIIVEQDEGGSGYKRCDGINIYYDKEPFIFLKGSNGVFSAMIKNDKK